MQGIRKIKLLVLFFIFVVFISYQPLANLNTTSITLSNQQQKTLRSYLSNRYTQKETNLNLVTSQVSITEDYKKFGESDTLEVYVHPNNLSLLVRNTQTNYIWSSTFNTEGEDIIDVFKPIVKSAISIDYFVKASSSDMKLESILSTDNQSNVSINYLNNGLIAQVKFAKSGIELKLRVSLENNQLVVQILNDEIKEPKLRLAKLRLYPYFGAIKGYENPGYIFVPDGTGALMRFNNPNYKTKYEKQVYSKDLGFITPSTDIDNEYVRNDEFIYFPVFGMAHGINQNAYLASIDSGSGYSSIGVIPAGVTTDFHSVYPEFSYRYRFQQYTSRNNSIEMSQKDRNQFDIKVTYTFLENQEANYVGMARNYQKQLVSLGYLAKTNKKRNNIPMRLEFLGSERTKGLIFDRTIQMTSVSEMNQIIQDIQSNQINDLTIVYQGWSKGGLTGTSPNYFPLDRKNGKVTELQELSNGLDKTKSNFMLYTDYTKAYENARGYSRINDLAKKANTLLITGRVKNYNYHLLSAKATQRLIKEDYNNYQKYGIDSLALQGVGNLLFTDFNDGFVSREQSKEIYSNIIKQIDGNVALYRANNYMLNGLDYYFDTPVYSSQYLKFDDTVPFIPIVLSGYIENYSTFSNFFADPKDELLRLIDFGVYPSFILTKEASHALINTASEKIYTSRYEDWKDELIRQYHFVNNALKNVYGEEIIAREVLEFGVIQVTYSNGIRIIVNYTNDDYNHNGLIIPAKNYRNTGD